MTQQYHNPFAGLHLIAPVDQREDYNRYCQRQQTKRTNVDRSPFPRMVDFWFTGLSLAAREELNPVNLGKQKTFRFHEGSVFNSDSWRVQVVMLVAIATEGNVEIVGQPSRMMAIANGLAASGVPHIVDMLCESDQDPIWNLSQSLENLLQSDIGKEKSTDYTRLAEAFK